MRGKPSSFLKLSSCLKLEAGRAFVSFNISTVSKYLNSRHIICWVLTNPDFGNMSVGGKERELNSARTRDRLSSSCDKNPQASSTQTFSKFTVYLWRVFYGYSHYVVYLDIHEAVLMITMSSPPAFAVDINC